MNTNERKIDCISEYIEIIMSYFSKRKPNSFYEKERVFFRGQSRDYPLVPSVARPIRTGSNDTFIRFEANMVKTAKLQEPEAFANVTYPVNMLAKMQHYGLPTRLLDITENALVALYFACNKDVKYEGKIYCFKAEQIEIHDAYSIYVNLAAFLYTEPNTVIDISQFINTAKYESFFPRAERDKPMNKILDSVLRVLDKPLFVLPEMLSEREKRQQAAMLVFPNDISKHDGDSFNKEKPHYFTDQISDIKYRNIPQINLTISVDGKQKKKILRELELLGISEQFLFPEIENKCKAIKKQVENVVNETFDALSADEQD